MSYTKLAVRGALTVLGISILAAFAGYLVRLVLARNLNVEEFGLFYAVFAFLSIIGVFKTLGFDASLIKFIPEFMHRKEYGSVKSAIIYAAAIQLVTNIIIIFGVYLFSRYLSINFFHSAKADIVLKLMVIAVSIDSFVLVTKFALQGFKEMAYFSAIDLIRMLLILAAVLIGFKLNYGILSPLIAYVLVPIILIIIFGWVLIKKAFPEFAQSKFVINKKLIKDIFGYSIFIMATTLGGIVFGYTDTIVLTYFSGLTSVALYSVALPTAKLFLYFPRAIGGILLPLTAEFWVKKKEDMIKAGLESLYKYSMIILVPGVFIMFSFSELIIMVLFGKEFILASNILKILSIGMIFTAIYGVNINFFAGIGKPQINSKIIYSAAIFNLVSNLILIPIIGITGAAITNSMSYFIMMIIGLVYIRDFIKVDFPILIWAKTLLAGMAFIFAILLLRSVLAMNVWLETSIVLIISGAVYIAFLFLLKVINIYEIKDLHRRIIG